MKNPLRRLWSRLGSDPERTLALARHVGRQFNQDQCFVSAGMLTYATLLSLVPFTTVVVSMVAALPGAGDWNDQIQDFLFRNFVPAARDTIQAKVNELIANAKGLTAAMGIFLVATSIILMHNVETTINRIFAVRTERSWIGRFMMYWAALTLGPILLGASLALSSYFFSLRIFADVRSVGFMSSLVQGLTPFAVAGLAFFLTYMAIPNRRVPLRHALVGALSAAVMFELAKKAFGFYVSASGSYTAIYGALATIPIFLVWIYLSWSIILLGASLTAALGSFHHDETLGESWPDRELFLLVYRVVGHLWRAQQIGQAVDESKLLDAEQAATDKQISEVLDNLRKAHIVQRNETGDWVLVRDLTQLSLGDLYRTGTYAWPGRNAESLQGDDPWIERLRQALDESDEAMRKVQTRSMTSFYAGGIREEHVQDLKSG